ncbi:hypothetical protein B5P43_07000 [Bacillus sp. SRB_336]|nr:hypothetical protein B5P43_07000 [Bacillus sp. SRB_336]
MRIKQVRIKNFRSFADETIVFGEYTSLVGPNGAGKSTILSALNVFFKEQTNATSVEALSEEDFHRKNTGERVEISVTFYQLSPRALNDLSDYVRGNELIVSAIAIWDEGKKVAPVQQFGSRMGIAALAPFFQACEKGSAQDATNAFEALKQQFPRIGAPAGRSKDAKLEAVREFEREPANAHLLAPIESQDQFYGIAGNTKLRPYIQWVYVPAVKDAVDEQSESRDGALGRLLVRTVRGQVNFKEELLVIEQKAQREYMALLQANKEGLDRVAQSLTVRMSQWSHPEVALKLNWNGGAVTIREPTAKVSAGEYGFEGDLARFGHGFQRSYLLSLLQELATLDLQDAPTLALGIEEPELISILRKRATSHRFYKIYRNRTRRLWSPRIALISWWDPTLKASVWSGRIITLAHRACVPRHMKPSPSAMLKFTSSTPSAMQRLKFSSTKYYVFSSTKCSSPARSFLSREQKTWRTS